MEQEQTFSLEAQDIEITLTAVPLEGVTGARIKVVRRSEDIQTVIWSALDITELCELATAALNAAMVLRRMRKETEWSES